MGEFPTSISPRELQRRIGAAGGPVVLDVRRQPAYAEADTIIPAAVWRDPRLVHTWGGSLGRDAEVVVYCVHGHEVSQDTAAALRKLGVRARYLEGGIEAYRALGAPLAPKDAGAGR